jgi:hypothetical protein
MSDQFVCHYCGETVDPREYGLWHRVVGWERKGKSGGSDIAFRQQVDGFAHDRCVSAARLGVNHGQETLL